MDGNPLMSNKKREKESEGEAVSTYTKCHARGWPYLSLIMS
jgi:hypothetical protein